MDTTINPPPATTDAEPHLHGDLAIWFFILAELMAFGVFFIAYAVTRAYNVEAFNAAQAGLDRNIGALNTILLITGSWGVVRSVQAARADRLVPAVRWMGVGLVCGLAFLVAKIFEYRAKFAAGLSMDTDTFHMFYFSLTFFHFMHVVLGVCILGILLLKLRRGGYGSHDVHGLETGAAYWHMVDLAWIVLFPLVYVMH
ncbi:MAG: cytochrome c oxidase subunit 3 family protein [Rhodocyclaceae bacterium]|nr:cytochrome c oxidase subunit 3 family protein [Rhodocyclaceae bacterium]